MQKRKQDSKTIRQFLKNCCEVCGNSDLRVLIIHHKKRVCDGGQDLESNLQTLCANCHRIAHSESYQKEKKIIEEGAIKTEFRFPVECSLCGIKTTKTYFSDAFYPRPLCESCFEKKKKEWLNPADEKLEEESEIKEWLEQLSNAKFIREKKSILVRDFRG